MSKENGNVTIACLIAIFTLIVEVLSSREPTLFVSSPSNQTACEGSDVFQTCQISDKLLCLWFLNNKLIDVDGSEEYAWQANPEHGECAFAIKPATSKHAGYWQCGYSEPEEQIVLSAKGVLDILIFPLAPQLIATINDNEVAVSQGTITYNERDKVELSCYAECSHAPTNFTWSIDGRNTLITQAISTNGDLAKTESKYLVPKERTEANSVLKCNVRHSNQPVGLDTPNVKLNFQYATTSVNLSSTGRQIMMTGARAVFKCIGDGNPEPECEWLKMAIGGNRLEQVQTPGPCVYTIDSFDSNHEGKYTCLAGNILTKGYVVSGESFHLVLGAKIKNKVAIIGGVIGGLLGVIIIGMTITIIVLRRRKMRPNFEKALPNIQKASYIEHKRFTEHESDYLSPGIRSARTDAMQVASARKFSENSDSDSDTIYEEIRENKHYVGGLAESSA